MKKLITILLVAVLLVNCVAFAACNPSQGANDPNTIKIWWPGGSQALEDAIEKAKELYEAEHDGITIDIKTQSTNDFYESYTMALMGKDFPDIAFVDHVFVQRLAFDGFTANLSELGVDDVKDQFIDSLWKTTQYQGSTYALPMSANVLTMAYNQALLSKVLGREFTAEDYPSNWEEFLALGEKIDAYNKANNLTGNDKLYLTTVPAGTGAESMGAMFFMSYSAREGGTLMNDDLTAMTLSSEANMRAATKIKQLGDLGYTPTTFSESGFETGRIAFIEMGPWKMTDYARISEANENVDIRYSNVIPMTEGGSAQGALGLYSLVVTKKSTKAQIAADFVKFLTTNTEIQLMHNTVQNLMPTTKVALEDDFYKTDDWKVFIDQLNTNVARPGSAAWPTIENSLAQFVTELVQNGANGNPEYLVAIEIQLDEILEDLV